MSKPDGFYNELWGYEDALRGWPPVPPEPAFTVDYMTGYHDGELDKAAAGL